MRTNKFAQNLRAYRKFYGLSGKDLATEIEFGSAPTISQYERGKRYPKEEIIIRIANFFRITVDELLYGETPEGCLYKVPLDDSKTLLKMSKVGLPIYEVSETELSNNPLLEKAYEKHRHMTNKYYAGGYWSEYEFSECMEMYANSYENEEAVGAAANLLWFNSLMLFASKIGTIDKLNDLSDGIDAMTEKRKSVKIFLRDYALNSEYYEEECNDPYEDEELLITDEEFDDIIKVRYELFKFLKGDVKGSEYADFMLAMQFMYSLTSSRAVDSTSLAIGVDLLNNYVLMGNKYALDFMVESYRLNPPK